MKPSEQNPVPRVGTAAIIIQDNKVLLGLRKGSHAAGVWALPGGHLEFEEEFEECLPRELEEETGLLCTNIEKFTFTNNILKSEGKHYVTLYFICQAEGEPEIREPDKCDGWKFFGLDELPENLWPGLAPTLERAFQRQ